MGQVQETGMLLNRSRGKHSATPQRWRKEKDFLGTRGHGIMFSASLNRWTESKPGVMELSLRRVGWRFDYSPLLFLFCLTNSFGNCT